jgi:hypothetical protein
MRTLILAAVMIGLCSPVGCKKAKYPQPDTQLGYGPFKQFQPAGGKFIVQMPGTPQETRLSEAGKEVVAYIVLEINGTYGVAYSDEPIPADASASQIRSHLDGAFQFYLRESGATLTSESDITLAGKYPGREFKAKLAKFNHVQHSRFYAVDGRVYRLAVMGTPGYVASPETSIFFDSFAVTP